VRLVNAVEEALAELSEPAARIALDNYESEARLSELILQAPAYVLALGAERGWSGRERDTLREAGFRLAGLGERVLRVETASVAAVSVVLSKLSKL
jgi:RsmE family RNA methyltransferase